MQEIFTIGHSTRRLEEFIELLKSQKVTQLVDVRTVPRSRHNPQYEQTSLTESLPQAGVKYVYLKVLGGLRPSVKPSANTAWRNKSFRNYADYMQTDEFKRGIETLIGISKENVTAIMCAEAVPWRCHRSLIGDALVIRSIVVSDIISDKSIPKHTLTSFAVANGTSITYPGDVSEEQTSNNE